MIWLIVIIAVVMILSLGIAYYLYSVTRPKREGWTALVYTVGEGAIKKKGNYTLSDLNPLRQDYLEKIVRRNGSFIFRLQTLNKTTPEPTANSIENWGIGQKIVRVIMVDNRCTLLKSGYDRDAAKEVFEPVPYDKFSYAQNEKELRMRRLESEKNPLEYITKWITTALTMISLIAIVFLLSKGFVEMSENNLAASENYKEGATIIGEAQIKSMEILTGQKQKINKLGEQTKQDSDVIPTIS